jgi:cysteinyl-tRNA synthetase
MQADKYSKFDDEGIPTHDSKGFEISKEVRNKIKKEFLKHEENYKKWLEKQNSDTNK